MMEELETWFMENPKRKSYWNYRAKTNENQFWKSNNRNMDDWSDEDNNGSRQTCSTDTHSEDDGDEVKNEKDNSIKQ